MIKLINKLPPFAIEGIESFKIKSDYSLYKDRTRFYLAESGGVISISEDGTCVLSGELEGEELFGFLNFLSPKIIVCGSKLSGGLNLAGYNTRRYKVLSIKTGDKKDIESEQKSDFIYNIFKTEKSFYLPPYENFAVDYCRRKNHGALKTFTVENKAAALAFVCEDSAYISGVVSREKGLGSIVLRGLLSQLDNKTVYAAAKRSTAPFYIKNGFTIKGDICYLIKG